MLHLIPTDITSNKTSNKKAILYWIVSIEFPGMNPLQFSVSSIKHFSIITGIKDTTLRKLVYDKNYNSKKYGDAFKHIKLAPVYV